MKTLSLVLALALVPMLAPLAAADPIGEVATCAWNHALLPDQYVTYNGFVRVTVGVRFLDGAICQVQVVCGGTINGRAFVCVIPPLP